MRDKFPDQPEELFSFTESLPTYPDRETDFSTTDRLENLIQTLDTFDKLAEVENLLSRFRNQKWFAEQEQSLGKNIVYKWRRQKYEEHQELADTAKQMFLKAYPPSPLEDGHDETAAQAESDRLYGIFEQAYRGTSHGRFKKRAQTRAEYQAYIDEKTAETVEEPNSVVSTETVQAVGANALQHVLEPELARTKDKLIGLRDDSRAGFLPTTHTEKNQAFELLDYMSTKEGPTKRLYEIFRHQQKDGIKKGLKRNDIYTYSIDAVRAVTQEWGDHLHNAMKSHDELVRLKDLLDSGINPRISTMEAVEDEADQQYDYNTLVRFTNLKSLRDGAAFAFDPLRTRQDRSILHPDKNKIVEDVHTAVGSTIEIQHFVDEVAAELSVKDSRQLVHEAIADQAARRLFWYRALKAVVDYEEDGFQEQARRALQTSGAPLPS